MLAPEKSHLPLFMNRNGQKLTRAGVTYILNKYAKAASVIDPSIPEKIPPHLMRHTKAMHIYDADNDLVHVRDFLGHSDIKTTDIYARSSLTMKQKALERVSDSSSLNAFLAEKPEYNGVVEKFWVSKSIAHYVKQLRQESSPGAVFTSVLLITTMIK